MTKNAIIVLSGGMDSVTLLHQYKERIALAVSFDYGSNHNQREIACAKRQTALLNIEHVVIPLDFFNHYFKSALLSGADEIPEGSYNAENMQATVVPFRNGIMLAIACGMAESRGLTEVMIANHGGDHAIYPDCRDGFIRAMSSAMQQGTAEEISIFAPYTLLKKTDIAAIGKKLGVQYEDTYSCYKGCEKHCGVCATCIERKEALAQAGIADHTSYLA